MPHNLSIEPQPIPDSKDPYNRFDWELLAGIETGAAIPQKKAESEGFLLFNEVTIYCYPWILM